MTIPVAGPWVNVADLDPELARRVDAACNDRRLAGRVRVSSGYRSLAEQWVLWRRYLAGGNLAAYPGTSNHGRGQAVDIGWWDPSRADWGLLRAVGTEHGIRLTVFTPQFEPWHFEKTPTFVPPPAPVPTPPTLGAVTVATFDPAPFRSTDTHVATYPKFQVWYRQLARSGETPASWFLLVAGSGGRVENLGKHGNATWSGADARATVAGTRLALSFAGDPTSAMVVDLNALGVV